ncbi:MAG: hypothetical protein OEZ40_11635 [Candidatus Bathyarchaeota archaeon]|nr:hypothetical protein [Candidatus Bathyarchaeota archaeon]
MVKCVCGKNGIFIIRGDLDKHTNELQDEIWECNECHRLYRVFYKIDNYVLLKEEPIKEMLKK